MRSLLSSVKDWPVVETTPTEPESLERRLVLVVRNPRSGAGDRRALMDRLERQLIEAGFVVRIESDLDELSRQLASATVLRDLRTVISAGGDGTASVVATRVPSAVPITLFPLGTENLLARWLGATTDIEATVAAIQRLEVRRIDAATANGKLALIMIGVGYDAQVVHEVHRRRTGHITKWAYGWPMVRNAFGYSFPELRIQANEWINLGSDSPDGPLLPRPERWAGKAADPETLNWSARWLFVANLPTYAGGLSIVPYARADDGYLCAASFQRGSAIPGLAYAAAIYLRQQHWLSDYRVLRARRFRVECDEEVRFQIDGDDGGPLPLDIEVMPDRVTLVVPVTVAQ